MTIEPIGPGAFRVLHDERSDIVYAAGSNEERWIFCNGQVFIVAAAATASSGPRPPQTAGRVETLTAPMPARVVQVLVQPKAAVKKGDTLVLLEAMKMELPIRTPIDAEVVAVHCQVGQLVDANATLIDLR